MKEFFFALVPGSVFVYRYAPQLQIPRLIGFALMEIVPFLIVAWLEQISVSMVVLGFLLLYSVYEIGYIQNDLLAKKEEVGMTERSQFAGFNPITFFTLRVIPIVGMGCLTYSLCPESFTPVMFCLLILFAVFIVHNALTKPRWRIASFIALNTLKIWMRVIILSPAATFYVLGALPHLIVKLIHYLGAKTVVNVSEETMRTIALPIYLGSVPLLAFVDPKLVLFCLPYLLNHCKAELLRTANTLLVKHPF
jgi:hypothetical protein